MTDISKALRELLLARAAGMIDPEEFARREAALHAELLAESAAESRRRWWLLGAALAVVAIAIGIYAWQASSSTPTPASPPPVMPGVSGMPPAMPGATAGMPPAQQQPNAGGDLNTMAVRLAEKLAKNPTNGEGWALLGQTYMELRQYKDADLAFAKANALGKLDARLKEEWTKAKAATGGK